MPWFPKDAIRKTKKANTPKKKKQWAATANNVLKRTGDEGLAIKIADAAIHKAERKIKRKRG